MTWNVALPAPGTDEIALVSTVVASSKVEGV